MTSSQAHPHKPTPTRTWKQCSNRVCEFLLHWSHSKSCCCLCFSGLGPWEWGGCFTRQIGCGCVLRAEGRERECCRWVQVTFRCRSFSDCKVVTITAQTEGSCCFQDLGRSVLVSSPWHRTSGYCVINIGAVGVAFCWCDGYNV